MSKTVLVLSLAAAFGASACNKATPCSTYVDAVAACYGSTDSDAPEGYDLESACPADVVYSDAYYGCLAASYDDGDCATPDGLEAIATAIGACKP